MSTSDATTSSSTNKSFKTPRTRIETLNALQYNPFCPEEKKPKVGQVFETLESAELFYKEYCTICGSTPRLATTKGIKANELPNSFALRNVVCNRQGAMESRKRMRTDTDTDTETTENDAQSDVTDISRVRPITRIDCRTLVQFKYQENGTYIITRFDETHHHPLASPASTIFLKGNQKMTEVQNNLSQRNIKTYVGNFDAQMFVENLIGKKDTCSSFYFDFIVEENKCLAEVFCADPICIKNYMLFGEVLLADATYRTNKYDMLFVPITGVDHHKRCITFGAELIGDESIECYRWLFKTFLEAMGGLNRCVWNNQLEPDEFEEQWGKIMTDYQLVEHEWFSDLYNIRKQWIPAYFKDVSISGFMRVTSRSESENRFFDRFLCTAFGFYITKIFRKYQNST
ncbi:protein FAR1-RELATED SEQUENCE 5-like [Silene latifolia]|uniref:protein FAR1-RELATED SEQUENCE 5-like n=1 Tax=Silene latifolia TaxID=37657 RepID=UPI003D76E555